MTPCLCDYEADVSRNPIRFLVISNLYAGIQTLKGKKLGECENLSIRPSSPIQASGSRIRQIARLFAVRGCKVQLQIQRSASSGRRGNGET